ncbi:hypothetical protein HMPREF3036_02596 [Sutterella sp. KLE1602]|nr:hypothetical protein HMPREF3036_02596 [Sutterella sp. KLE1602]
MVWETSAESLKETRPNVKRQALYTEAQEYWCCKASNSCAMSSSADGFAFPREWLRKEDRMQQGCRSGN